MQTLDRRLFLTSAAFLMAGCDQVARGKPPGGPVPPLRSVSPIPVGCCLRTDQFADKALIRLLSRNFSQITPEWEMKMSYLIRPNGQLRFDAADRLIAFAHDRKMAVHGHALIWYKYDAPQFQRLAKDRTAFLAAYRAYITQVASRWKGRIRGWDVVNEPVENMGGSLRDCLWSRVLGEDGYIVEAFEAASRADPKALLFINEYSLEKIPAKRKTFLQLIERLLKKGAKIGGIGTQTHIRNDMPRGQISAAIRDLASFGLPLHISELDISFRLRGGLATNLDAQTETASELVEAFMALPEKQRYALSFWGARDKDSWLMQPPFNDFPGNQPLPFTNDGNPKPMTAAIAEILRQHR